MADADHGERAMDRAVHYANCNHALCPCYLDGLRAGVKPTGRALLGALEAVVADAPTDGSEVS